MRNKFLLILNGDCMINKLNVLNTYLKSNKTAIRYGVVCLTILILGTIYCISVLAKKDKEAVEYYHYQTVNEESLYSASENDNKIISSNENQNSKIYVYICGCVKNPGVYPCVEGTRVYEIIDMAGGLTEEAYVQALNLADIVQDKDKIDVPDMESFQNQENLSNNSIDIESSSTKSTLININTASLSELTTLPGIGESRAKDIIEYRIQHGKFNFKEDIMKINGIKEAAYSKIKDYITV